MKRLADFILANPKSILGFFLILTVAAVYPAFQIRTDFNLENFFPENDPAIKDYQKLEEEFGRDDNVIMVGFRSDSLLTGEVLQDLKAIADSAEQIPGITEVRSLWSAEQIESDGYNLNFDPYLPRNLTREPERDSLKQELLTDPFARGFLINEEANATAFYLEIEEDKNNYSVRNAIIEDLQQLLEPYSSRYEFKISGIPYYRNQYISYLNNEIIVYVSLASLLVIILLWVLYRSKTGVLIPMLVVWMTILFTLAVMQLTGGYFEVMTSTIAPILLCVGIADSIHMISKYDDARLQGLDKKNSIREMLMTLGSATFLTSITTAIGFGTLMTSDIVPMKRFGIYTAAGVMIAFIITIFLLPGFFSLTRVKQVFKDHSAGIFTFFSTLLKSVSRLTRKHYKTITAVILLISLGIGYGSSFLKINGKVFDELGEETEPIQHARFFSEHLSPPFPMEFIIDTGTENGIVDPALLQRLEGFTDYLYSFSEVERVTSFNTVMKQVHEAMAPGKAQTNPLPENEQLLAQYVLLLEINNSDILERIADFSYSKVRVSAQVRDVGSYRINEMREEIDRYLSSHFPDEEVTVTGTTILSADLNGKIVSSLLKSVLLAFMLIAVIMGFLFRNIQMVFLSLVPNVLPLIVVAGIMGYAGIDIKSSTAVIFTIAFGIAVDDSIHYLARLRVEMKRGRSLEEALQLATRKTGKAIIVTSLILITGFGTLLTSVFTSTFYMGLLVCITVGAALLADLLLLPSLFYWLRPKITFPGDGEKPASTLSRADRPEEEWHQE